MTHLPYSLSTPKPDQSTSSAKSIHPIPALPYSLSTIKPDQSKAGLKSIRPTPAPPYSPRTTKQVQLRPGLKSIPSTPALPYSRNTFRPAQSKTLAKPVPPTLALEWSEWPNTKPVKGKFAQPFDEQTKDSLQVDFNFFSMDGEDTVFELREVRDHGRYQTRSDFENDVASYQRVSQRGNHGVLQTHTLAINIVVQGKAADVAKGNETLKSELLLKSIAKVKKAASALAKGVDFKSAAKNGAGDKGEELADLKSKEDTFWRSKNTSKQSIEELLSGDTPTSKTSTVQLQTIATHAELIKHCERLYASNTKRNCSIIYAGKLQSTTDAIAEGDEKRVNRFLEAGLSHEAIDPIWKNRPTHPRVCKCGCQKNEPPHSLDEWCRCGCAHYYFYER